jgi:uncharacterized protein YbbK (DUF523 family)
VPVCPEVEIGLGVPRKPIRVVESKGIRMLVQSESGRDMSGPMNEFVERFLGSVTGIDGFILKNRSPSCGNKDVKIYPPGEKVSPLTGSGSGFSAEPYLYASGIWRSKTREDSTICFSENIFYQGFFPWPLSGN